MTPIVFFSIFTHLCSVTVQTCFLHEWTSHQLGIWVHYPYDSLHLHSCQHVNNMTLSSIVQYFIYFMSCTMVRISVWKNRGW
jgi:hypothetical protein